MNAFKSASLQQINDWKTINWNTIINYVTKLQQQIFLAEKNHNIKKVQQLQRTLIHSKANLLLSIKDITNTYYANRHNQDNIINEKLRIKLYNELITYNIKNIKPLILNRIYNDIDVIKDKIFQKIIIRALEPQWEVHFEPNSYCRPGRYIQDAISSIYNKVGSRKHRKWVVQIDFNNYFDNINTDYILSCIDNFSYKNVIAKWLNANYIHTDCLKQSSIELITTLLINICLHGLEQTLGIRYNNKHVQISKTPSMVRYANHCVIFCYTEQEAINIKTILKDYLQIRGLSSIQFDVMNIEQGFDFLDFNVRLYKANKNLNNHMKLLIKPSKDSIKRVINNLKAIFDKYKGSPIRTILSNINPIIIGAAYSWRTIVASPAYKYIDYYVDYKLYKHLRRMHPHKNWHWIKKQYYKQCITGSLGFHVSDPKDPTVIRKYCRDISIKRHVLVTFNNSIYDPDLKEYWDKHFKQLFCLKHDDFKIKLAQRQKFLCPRCKNSLCNESVEVNHIISKKFNGTNVFRNLQLIHTSCHIEHHQQYKTYDDFIRYEQEQKNWYDSLWTK